MTCSKTERESLRPDLLATLIRELAADGHLAELPVYGNSMRPLLEDGDRVRVVPVRPGDLRLGDVVVRLASTGPVIHRMVGWWPSRQGWRALTKGDGVCRLDAPGDPTGCVGRVIARVRDGRLLLLDNSPVRMRGHGRALVSLMAGLIVEVWDRGRGRTRTESV